MRLDDGLMSVWGVVDMLMLGVSCFVASQFDSDVGDRLVKL